jgi:hypothetical protein
MGGAIGIVYRQRWRIVHGRSGHPVAVYVQHPAGATPRPSEIRRTIEKAAPQLDRRRADPQPGPAVTVSELADRLRGSAGS